jgi:hypothetical protein
MPVRSKRPPARLTPTASKQTARGDVQSVVSNPTPESQASRPATLIARLARHFANHPGRWIDGHTLSAIGGCYAWRSRCSDLRRAPYNMRIENRQRRVAAPDGGTYVVSEYRFLPTNERTEEGQQAGVHAPPAAE